VEARYVAWWVDALQKESYSFQLAGCATEHIIYVRGGEPLTADVQSLSALPQPDSDESQSFSST